MINLFRRRNRRGKPVSRSARGRFTFRKVPKDFRDMTIDEQLEFAGRLLDVIPTPNAQADAARRRKRSS